MYIFKSNSSQGVDEKLSKPSNGALAPLADAAWTRLPTSVNVPSQVAVLAGSSVSSPLTLASLVDSIATAGLVSTVALPLTGEYAPSAANEDGVNALVGVVQAPSKAALAIIPESSNTIVPITSLSEGALVQGGSPQPSLPEMPSLLDTIPSAPLVAPKSIVDASAIAPTIVSPSAFSSSIAPVLITVITDNELNVLSSANASMNLGDVAPRASVAHYVNTGTDTLTVSTTGTHLTTLTLTGPIAFTAAADEISTGITVSALADPGDVTLYLAGSSKEQQGSVDTITLGDGNNFVLDAGNGQVALNFGSGTNVVMLTGVGVSGNIQFAHHSGTVGEFVSLASNGVSTASALASNPLITISGLNNNAHSLDTITFLGDIGASLVWAGIGASGAQISHVSGDPSHLVNWVNAAQIQTNAAHSLAWFQFDGNTYLLETATGDAGHHAGDTLVRLTGLLQFSGADSELNFGVLHLAG